MVNITVPPRFEDIVAEAEMYFAAQSARATDFNPGSVVRTILEIAALIQERRDIAVWAGLDRAIDEAVFDAWGFVRQDAQPATGQITLYPGVDVTTPFSIRQGDLFRVPDSPTLLYEVTSTSINPDGTLGWANTDGTVWFSNPNISASTLNVRAVQAGTSGNVGAKLVTQAIATIPGVADIKNLQAFTNGRDASTDAERRAAFSAYIQSLPRGTVESLKYGAKTAAITDTFGLVSERVRKVALVEGTSTPTIITQPDIPTTISLGSGAVALFIHNGAGAMSADLLALTQNIINGYIDAQGVKRDGWRAAGIPATVYKAKEQKKAVVANITVAQGFLVDQVIELTKLAIQNVFAVLDVGQQLLYTDMLMFLKLVPGILEVSTLTIGGTTAPVTPDLNGLLTLDTITGVATIGNVQVPFSYPTG